MRENMSCILFFQSEIELLTGQASQDSSTGKRQSQFLLPFLVPGKTDDPSFLSISSWERLPYIKLPPRQRKEWQAIHTLIFLEVHRCKHAALQ